MPFVDQELGLELPEILPGGADDKDKEEEDKKFRCRPIGWTIMLFFMIAGVR